jgi:hypothetical protein
VLADAKLLWAWNTRRPLPVKPCPPMKRVLIGATFTVFALGAGVVGALDGTTMYGANRLDQLARDIYAQCPLAHVPVPVGPPGVRPLGGGSALGGHSMMAGTQTISHQTRPLLRAEGCSSSGTAEGLVVALDGLSIVGASTTAGMCLDGLAHTPDRSVLVADASGQPATNCPGCLPGTNRYMLRDWREVLALVYAGLHHDGSRNCASDVRRSMVDTWANLFEGSCPSGSCPAGLHRAFRRGDLAAETEAFAMLLGLRPIPPIGSSPGAVAGPIDFCNAGAAPLFGGQSDFQDNDPIRRACPSDEQVCGRDGTLGLVTVIEVPSNLTTAEKYPTELCGIGQFRLLSPAIFGGPSICPDGMPKLFNKCFLPVINRPDGTFTAFCIARRFPKQGLGGQLIADGRVYNQWLLNANGTLRRDQNDRMVMGAFYRLHTTMTAAPGAQSCGLPSSAGQVACLTQASPCSLGFSERALPGAPAGASPLLVKWKLPTVTNIQNLFTTPDPADDYVLTYKVYLNTLIGFEHPRMQTAEFELARCFGRASLVAPIAANLGFVPMPGGAFCEDFNGNLCDVPSSVNACADNPPGLISP